MKKRKDYITLMNVIAAFSVVILHANGCFWFFSKEKYWYIANVIDALFYYAVPLFFMITGVTLINYRDKYSTKTYFKKRFDKTVTPFVAWSIIGVIYLYCNNLIIKDDISITYLLNGLFNDPHIKIYWFFIQLFKVYLCIPLFSSVNKKYRKEVFSYLVFFFFFLNFLIPFIIDVFNLKLGFSINIPVSSGYLIYVLLGYLLDNYSLDKRKKIIIHVFGVIGLLIHIIGTYVLSVQANEVVRTFKEYINVPCILYSTSVFILIKDLSVYIKDYKYINIISKYTFSIYLIHIYILNVITQMFSLDNTRLIYRLGMPVIIIPLSILIAYCIRKIPILKKILP